MDLEELPYHKQSHKDKMKDVRYLAISMTTM